MDIRERAKQLQADIPAVFIAMKDRDTPFIARLFAGLAVGYALSPIDLIPDFIPVIGCLDDIVIVPALTALAVRSIPPDVWARSRTAAEGLWQDGRPKKWYFAVPAAAVWLAVLWLIAKAIWF